MLTIGGGWLNYRWWRHAVACGCVKFVLLQELSGLDSLYRQWSFSGARGAALANRWGPCERCANSA